MTWHLSDKLVFYNYNCMGLIPLYFGVFLILYSQILSSSGAREPFLFSSSHYFHQIVSVMLQSRATSTIKAYLRAIKRFLEWCKMKNVSVQLPFSVSTDSLYLFESHQSCASSASLIQTHAALKWFHSFVPSLDRNPFG